MYNRNPALSFEEDPAMQGWRDKGWIKDPAEFYRTICDWDRPPEQPAVVVSLPSVRLQAVPELPDDIAQAS